MLASVISGGQATHQIGASGDEFGLSQIFLCLDPERLGMNDWIDQKLDEIINNLHDSSTFPNQHVRYPGEHILAIRKKNMKEGVPVDPSVWGKIQGFLS